MQNQNKPTKLLNEMKFKKKLPYFFKTSHDTLHVLEPAHGKKREYITSTNK